MGRVINFEIVVPTAKGEVYVYKFIQGVEVVSVCTNIGASMIINTALCLLGHRNKHSVRKTVKQMGRVLMRGTFRPCKHCAKSKAKQKNVQKESVVEKTLSVSRPVKGHGKVRYS